MKTLELNQMEQIQGGSDMLQCLGAAGGAVSTLIGVGEVVVAVSAASGPVGWGLLAIGLGALSLYATLSEGDPCD